jgi:hypothetical protein
VENSLPCVEFSTDFETRPRPVGISIALDGDGNRSSRFQQAAPN